MIAIASRSVRTALWALLAISGCKSTPSEPAPEEQNKSPSGSTATGGPIERPAPQAAAPRIPARPVASVKPSPDDPLAGKFSLDDAVAGLEGSGALAATIETDVGTLECKLYDDKAPNTVANFVGLARGIRPWKNPEGQWVKKPAYDGTIFHRIIKGFMIQGGDPKGIGSGEPGYVVPDEIWENALHDRAGLLCMANRGPNTNGAQFFITDALAKH
ncbi:MAG TPA: peptidylprolyl isomerase, partial [Polyangiaceae bacterium]|nr:peptidylprolyl isomerase [Polyangiaceae bacterium]